MTPAAGVSVRRGLAPAVAILLGFSMSAGQAAITAPRLKAAFLYNFARFAEWPEAAARASPLTICVLGDEAVAGELDRAVKGHDIDGREVVVSRVMPEGARACDVLYMTGLDRKRSQQILDDTKGAPVLTVSDRDRFAQTGGIVGLFVEGGRMRFNVNLEAAHRARLQISSRLLSLATRVTDDDVH